MNKQGSKWCSENKKQNASQVISKIEAAKMLFVYILEKSMYNYKEIDCLE